jgi:hypothetical protein
VYSILYKAFIELVATIVCEENWESTTIEAS